MSWYSQLIDASPVLVPSIGAGWLLYERLSSRIESLRNELRSEMSSIRGDMNSIREDLRKQEEKHYKHWSELLQQVYEIKLNQAQQGKS